MKVKFCFLPFFVLVFFLAGCYDNMEIDSLANVVALGIECDKDSTKYTFAVADMTSFSSDGDGGAKSGMICCTAAADSIDDAVKNVNGRISKTLSFSHMTIIMFSEDYAADGVGDVVEYFEENPEVRPQTLVAVSDFKPSEYLEKISPVLEVNTEKYFLGIFQNKYSHNPSLMLSECTNAAWCGKKAKVPVISGNISDEEIKEEQVYISGAENLNLAKR